MIPRLSKIACLGILSIIPLSLGVIAVAFAEQEPEEVSAYFDQYEATGSIVIVDERGGSGHVIVHDDVRSSKRFSPASTFKVPHSLFALDAGAIVDEFQVVYWDGKRRFYEPWNRDQTLRSSMRNSTVWVYEGFAEAIGLDSERTYLQRIDYGNADPSGEAPFWIAGNLMISAQEQVRFLQKLYRNDLPFKVEHQRLVKDVMIVEAGREWILRAKSGWDGSIGWWVGWVEWPTGPVFFALNIDTPLGSEDLDKREAIPRAILRSIGALPSLE